MKIAVLHFHRLGGSGIIAYEIASAMVARGHEVHFVGLKPPMRYALHNGADITKMFFHKIDLMSYHVFQYQPYDLAAASQLADVVEKHNIDVVHCHYAIPHTLIALQAKSMVARKLRIVTTLHGTDITVVGAHPSMLRISRYGLQQSDEVVAVSNYLSARTKKTLAIENVHTIYNFLPNHFLNNDYSPCKISSNEERWVLHASNLREVKAPFDVITIFQKMLQNSNAVLRLVFAGDGPLRESLQEKVRVMNLSDKVTFLGEVLDIKTVYSRSCFFLLPSYEEAFGLGALEAMAFGLPVLASQAGGLPEVIDDGINGFLFPERDLDVGVEKICRVVDDENYYKQISNAARETAANKFPLKKVIDAYEKLYIG